MPYLQLPWRCFCLDSHTLVSMGMRDGRRFEMIMVVGRMAVRMVVSSIFKVLGVTIRVVHICN